MGTRQHLANAQTRGGRQEKLSKRKATSRFDRSPDWPAPLPDSEIRELIRRHRAGDTEAGGKVVLHNMRSVSKLATKIAMKFDSHNTAQLRHELEGEGVLVILDSMKPGNFDTERHDAKYFTYVHRAVAHRMGVWAFCNARGISRLPNHTVGLYNRLKAANKALKANPEDPRLRRDASRARRLYQLVQLARMTPESMSAITDGTSDDASAPSRGDFMQDPCDNPTAALEHEDDLAAMRKALARVQAERPELAEVVVRNYGLDGQEPEILRSIAVRLGIPFSSASWRSRKAVQTMGYLMGVTA